VWPRLDQGGGCRVTLLSGGCLKVGIPAAGPAELEGVPMSRVCPARRLVDHRRYVTGRREVVAGGGTEIVLHGGTADVAWSAFGQPWLRTETPRLRRDIKNRRLTGARV